MVLPSREERPPSAEHGDDHVHFSQILSLLYFLLFARRLSAPVPRTALPPPAAMGLAHLATQLCTALSITSFIGCKYAAQRDTLLPLTTLDDIDFM